MKSYSCTNYLLNYYATTAEVVPVDINNEFHGASCPALQQRYIRRIGDCCEGKSCFLTSHSLRVVNVKLLS